MKYIYTLLFSCFITIGIAQNITSGINYHNVILKEVGDSLVMSFDVEVLPSAVKNRQSVIIVPELKGAEDNTLIYGYIQLNGKNRDKVLKRTEALQKSNPWTKQPAVMKNVQKKQATIFRYSAVVPYQEWMDEGYLTRSEWLLGCAKSAENSESNFGVRVEMAPRPPKIPAVAYVEPKPVIKDRSEAGSAYLDFRTNQHVIDPTYRRNPEELMRIMDIVYKTNNDKDITLHELSVTGYASPEGNATHNQNLSYRRANAFMDYIQQMSGIDREKFTVRSLGEDWEGFRRILLETEIPQQDKVLAIIDNDAELDRKEQQLKALGSVYRQVLDEIFPALRRVEYQISYTVRDYSLTEAQELLNSDPSKLNLYELYLLAKLHGEGTDKWNEIIELSVALYPNEPEANINAAAVYINKGEYAKAKACLDKVRNLPEAEHNLYIYEEMERQGLLD